MRTAALIAACLTLALPAAAQQAGRAAERPACTQLERSAGISGSRCGTLTVAEIALIITRYRNSMN